MAIEGEQSFMLKTKSCSIKVSDELKLSLSYMQRVFRPGVGGGERSAKFAGRTAGHHQLSCFVLGIPVLKHEPSQIDQTEHIDVE